MAKCNKLSHHPKFKPKLEKVFSKPTVRNGRLTEVQDILTFNSRTTPRQSKPREMAVHKDTITKVTATWAVLERTPLKKALDTTYGRHNKPHKYIIIIYNIKRLAWAQATPSSRPGNGDVQCISSDLCSLHLPTMLWEPCMVT